MKTASSVAEDGVRLLPPYRRTKQRSIKTMVRRIVLVTLVVGVALDLLKRTFFR